MRLARRFILAIVVAIVIVHGVSSFIRVKRDRDFFEQDIARDGRFFGRALAHAVEQTWRTEGEREALGLVAHATEHEGQVLVRWVWLAPTGEEQYEPVAPAAALRPLRRGQSVVVHVGDDPGAIYTYVPVRGPSNRIGAIGIADTLGEEQAYVERGIVQAVVSLVTLVLLCALLALMLGLGIGRPIRRLVDQARTIGRGDLSQRLSMSTRDELGQLAHEMDRMCDRLEESRGHLEAETEARIAAIEQLRHADRLTHRRHARLRASPTSSARRSTWSSGTRSSSPRTTTAARRRHQQHASSSAARPSA